MVRSAPGAKRIMAILEERGWTRIVRVPADRLDTQPGSPETCS